MDDCAKKNNRLKIDVGRGIPGRVKISGMVKDYESMSRAELEDELRRLRENLEDLEETLGYYYTSTQAHIPGSFVKQDEEEVNELKRGIARLEELLSRK